LKPPWLIDIGFVAMLGVPVCFLWSTAMTQPLSLGLVEFFLNKREHDRTTRAAALTFQPRQ
jgi:hypothetical protein